MKINSRFQLRSRRQVHPEFQLCRLLLSLPEKRTQRRGESEFDDRMISNTPQTHLSQRSKILEEPQNEFLRRQRIKSKIKSQVREKIKKIANQMSAKQEQRGMTSSQAKSQVFSSRGYPKLIGISDNCVIEQALLHQKPQKKPMIRSRMLSNIQDIRYQSKTSMQKRRPQVLKIKMSTPNLDAVDAVFEKLEPWRYQQEFIEQGIYRKLLH